VAVLLQFAVAPCVLQAADAERQYHVRAIENVASCSELNHAVFSAKKEDDWRALYAFSLYTMGYMTGINRLAFDTYDLGGKKNSKNLMVWLEKYCARNPDDSFDRALYFLTLELFPNRLSAKPGD